MDLDETIKEETGDRRGKKRRRWERRTSWGRHKAEDWDTPRLSEERKKIHEEIRRSQGPEDHWETLVS